MDTGEEKCDPEISQSIGLNKRRSREMATETTIVPYIFATSKVHSYAQC